MIRQAAAAGVLVALVAGVCVFSSAEPCGEVAAQASLLTASGLGIASGCTLPDSGTCFVDEEFNGTGLDTALWNPINSWVAGSSSLGTYLGCYTSSNITVSGGNAHLVASNNSRTACPTDYDAEVFGQAVPGPTSYDLAALQFRTKTITYGNIEIRAKMPGGQGLWPTIGLGGASCIAPSITAAFANGIYSSPLVGNCIWPYVQNRAGENDMIEISNGTTTTVGSNLLDFTIYTDTDSGAPYQGTIHSRDYAGAATFQNAWPNGVAIGDSTQAFHDYLVVWAPGVWDLYVDGTLSQANHVAWVQSYPMFLWLYNEVQYGGAANPIDAASLPQEITIDYIRWWCPPGVPCALSTN